MGSCSSSAAPSSSKKKYLKIEPIDENKVFWSFINMEKTEDNIKEFHLFMKKVNNYNMHFESKIHEPIYDSHIPKYPCPKTDKEYILFLDYFEKLIEITNFSSVPFLRDKNISKILLLLNLIQVIYYLYIHRTEKEIMIESIKEQAITKLQNILSRVASEYYDKINIINYWIELIKTFNDDTNIKSFYIINSESKMKNKDEELFEYKEDILKEIESKKEDDKEKDKKKVVSFDKSIKKLEKERRRKEKEKRKKEKQLKKERMIKKKEDEQRGYEIVQKIVKVGTSTYKASKTDSNGIIVTKYFKNKHNAYYFVYQE